MWSCSCAIKTITGGSRSGWKRHHSLKTTSGQQNGCEGWPSRVGLHVEGLDVKTQTNSSHAFVLTETSSSLLQSSSFRDCFPANTLTGRMGNSRCFLLLLRETRWTNGTPPSLGTPHALWPSSSCFCSIMTLGSSPLSQILDKEVAVILRFPKYERVFSASSPKTSHPLPYTGILALPPSHHL